MLHLVVEMDVIVVVVAVVEVIMMDPVIIQIHSDDVTWMNLRWSVSLSASLRLL